MTILRFDEEELVTKLDLLPGKFRAAFAAACAQRQLPNYVRFAARTTTGDPDLLTQILDRLWDALEGEPDDNALQRDLELCMSLIPDERREGAPDQMYAEGAVASTAYAIGAQLSGKSQEAAWAARRAYETLDSHFLLDAQYKHRRSHSGVVHSIAASRSAGIPTAANGPGRLASRRQEWNGQSNCSFENSMSRARKLHAVYHRLRAVSPRCHFQ